VDKRLRRLKRSIRHSAFHFPIHLRFSRMPTAFNPAKKKTLVCIRMTKMVKRRPWVIIDAWMGAGKKIISTGGGRLCSRGIRHEKQRFSSARGNVWGLFNLARETLRPSKKNRETFPGVIRPTCSAGFDGPNLPVAQNAGRPLNSRACFCAQFRIFEFENYFQMGVGLLD